MSRALSSEARDRVCGVATEFRVAYFECEISHFWNSWTALLVITCATDEGPVTKLMQTKTALWLGEISYSLYMVHWLALQVFGSGLPGLLACCVGTLVLHRYVEVPGRLLGKRWATNTRLKNSISLFH